MSEVTISSLDNPQLHPQTAFFLSSILGKEITPTLGQETANYHVTNILTPYRIAHQKVRGEQRGWAARRVDTTESYARGEHIIALQDAQELSEHIIRADIGSVMGWCATKGTGQRTVILGDQVLSPPFSLTDRQLDAGREYLGALGAYSLRGSVPDWNKNSSSSRLHRLVQLVSQWHEYFCPVTINTSLAARFIIKATHNHNRLASKGDEIPTDITTASAIFKAYTDEVQKLEKYLPNQSAQHLAQALSTENFLHYRQITGLTSDQLYKIFRRNRTDAKAVLEGIIELQQKLQSPALNQIGPRDINPLIVAHGAKDFRVVPAAMSLEIDSEQLLAECRARDPRISRKDVLWFFKTANPIAKARRWADMIQAATQRWPKHSYLPYTALNRLFRHPSNATMEDIVSSHMERMSYMQSDVGRLGLQIPLRYLINWSIYRPKSFRDSVPRHKKNCDILRECIEKNNETVPDDALSELAFESSGVAENKELALAVSLRYISLLQTLRDETEGNPNVQPWLLQSAATAYNIQRARRKLGLLLLLTQRGILTPNRRPVIELNSSPRETPGLPNHDIAPDPHMPQLESLSSDFVLEALLENLPTLEAEAVRCAFSLPTDYKEEEIAESLGIPLNEFESYVTTQLLPKLRK